MDKFAVIIIPVYKEDLSNFEKISLRQVFKILGRKYTICFICPEKLMLKEYYTIAQDYEVINVNHKRFSTSYFENIQSYNRLMLSLDFYKEFLNYEHMLIHQLDCYIFKDDLEYWCNQNYDYIGAPWLTYTIYNLTKSNKLKFFVKQYLYTILKKKVSEASLYYKVGNGGLSLRKIRKFYNILINYHQEVINQYSSNDSTSLFNEDVFWSYEVNKRIIKKLKIPNYKKAAHFSIDPCPSIGMKIIYPEIPFGCHAWQKNVSFWKKYIKDI
jgi:hypothetical protein